MNDYAKEVAERVAANAGNLELVKAAHAFTVTSTLPKYSYNYSALGRPIIQYPQDMVAMQELIWEIKPDLIIETGIAHGGSLIMSASMLALLDMCDAIESGATLDPCDSNRKVLGIDIEELIIDYVQLKIKIVQRLTPALRYIFYGDLSP